MAKQSPIHVGAKKRNVYFNYLLFSLFEHNQPQPIRSFEIQPEEVGEYYNTKDWWVNLLVNHVTCLHEIDCMVEVLQSDSRVHAILEDERPLNVVNHHKSTSKEVFHYQRCWFKTHLTYMIYYKSTVFQHILHTSKSFKSDMPIRCAR
jgi:hypothetical protein